MITANELRRGTTFLLEGEIYRVTDSTQTHLGRGGSTIRVRIKNLKTGATLERTYAPEERIRDVRLELSPVQYLYREGDLFHFMDTETYDQPALSRESLGEAVHYLKEGQELGLSFYENEPVEVVLPTAVDLKVVDGEPGLRGDTATAATKAVTLETGLAIRVPLFVEVGDTIRVDTRTGAYVTRV